jgi:hypothetical protein
MADQRAASTHYAILIGINAYPDHPLKGCVRDVQDIGDYLQGALNSVQIYMLTATIGRDPETSRPTEDPMHWPTCDNVIAALEKVTSVSKSGDFVYIHYSGHGTLVEPCDEFSNTCTGDLALVLLLKEGEDPRKKWLLGSRLALALKRMVDRGLVVTLVLDCCFSAAVYRYHHPIIRSIPYDINRTSECLLCSENSIADGTNSLATRDVSMRPNWLINPDGYAILVACGPQEYAKEPYQDGQSRGNLSYFLLKILKEYDGLGKKHKYIYQHLRAKFREIWPQQNPMLYGNIHQSFFGYTDSEIDAPSVSIVRREGSLQLQAGQAQGVCADDRFALYPLGSVGRDSKSWGDSVIAKVVLVRALTSDLELLESTPFLVQTGWIARPLTRYSLRKFSIRLASRLPCQEQLLAALKDRSLDVLTDIGEHQFSFQVVSNANANDDYEILDERDERIVNLPSMPQAQTDVQDICEIIEHLGRYMMARRLVNYMPTDYFLESFSAKIITRSGEVCNPECILEVREGEEAKFTLQVENKGKGSLYVYIYNIGPCWQVQNIYYGNHEVIPPHLSGRVFRRRLITEVPPEIREGGHGHCEDIIRLFITSQPTSFDLLELPKLGKLINRSKTNTSSREDSFDSPEDWAALSFTIRTLF